MLNASIHIQGNSMETRKIKGRVSKKKIRRSRVSHV